MENPRENVLPKPTDAIAAKLFGFEGPGTPRYKELRCAGLDWCAANLPPTSTTEENFYHGGQVSTKGLVWAGLQESGWRLKFEKELAALGTNLQSHHHLPKSRVKDYICSLISSWNRLSKRKFNRKRDHESRDFELLQAKDLAKTAPSQKSNKSQECRKRRRLDPLPSTDKVVPLAENNPGLDREWSTDLSVRLSQPRETPRPPTTQSSHPVATQSPHPVPTQSPSPVTAQSINWDVLIVEISNGETDANDIFRAPFDLFCPRGEPTSLRAFDQQLVENYLSRTGAFADFVPLDQCWGKLKDTEDTPRRMVFGEMASQLREWYQRRSQDSSIPLAFELYKTDPRDSGIMSARSLLNMRPT